jgi:hypothetical protein
VLKLFPAGSTRRRRLRTPPWAGRPCMCSSRPRGSATKRSARRSRPASAGYRGADDRRCSRCATRPEWGEIFDQDLRRLRCVRRRAAPRVRDEVLHNEGQQGQHLHIWGGEIDRAKEICNREAGVVGATAGGEED